MEYNVYIDGSWLFTQCRREYILANQMEYPDFSFQLDFSKLLILLDVQLGHRLDLASGDTALKRKGLYFYTAIFDVPSEPDPDWGDITWIRSGTFARRRFVDSAEDAGFSPEGVQTVPLRAWMVDKLRQRQYQEKMVDTSLVARLVEQAITIPDRLHVLISGDLDMLPAIQTVVPEYTETVVLATTHPDQYVPGEAQSSFRLSQFGFRHDPIYLDQHVEQLVVGSNVYRCSNRQCNRVFVRQNQVPHLSTPICKPCFEKRSVTKGHR
jgi:hypothetical protein